MKSVSTLSRRELIGALGSAVVAGSLPRWASAQPARLEVVDLSAALCKISGAGANVVVARTSAGLMFVDGGLEEAATGLVAFATERWPGARIEVLFNTNWRPEHTGANEILGAAGARILAHENTKLWLSGDFFVEWENRRYRPRPAAALPSETFYVSGRTELGDRVAEYWHLPRAHTDGDVCVFFPDDNVLAASDLVCVDRYPVVDYVTGGWIGGLESSTHALLDATDAATRIIPAEGPPVGRAALEAQLELCAAVRQRVADAFRQGMSLADFVASRPTREFDATRGSPDQFLALVYKGAWGHIRELGGVI